MTVRELRQKLVGLDPDTPVICDRYSDFTDLEEPTVIEVLEDSGAGRGLSRWKKYYSYQWPTKPKNVRRVLHFMGN